MSLQLQARDTVLQLPQTERFAAVQLWDIISRNRYFIVSCFAVALVAAAGYAWLGTPVYESAVSLRIDEKEGGVPALEALAILSERGSEINTEMQMLKSRTLTEATVDSLALQVSANLPASLIGLRLPLHRVIVRSKVFSFVRMARSERTYRYRLTRDGDFRYHVVDDARNVSVASARAGDTSAINGLQFVLAPSALQYPVIDIIVAPYSKTVTQTARRISVTRPQRDAQIVIVRHQNEDPLLAASVPNVLAAKFLFLRNQVQKTEARSTVRFLSEQIDTLASQLSATEEAVRAFREGNRVVSLSEEANVQVTEFAKLQADRSQKEAEREALAAALTAARAKSAREGADSSSAFRSLIAFPTLLSTNAAQFLQALNDAENQRALLLQRRTREDKDVQMQTARIRELEQQLSSIAQTYLDGLSSQIASIDAALSRFNQQLVRIPSKELQLAKLERQNKVLAEIFTLLQTRLQEAKIAQAVEDSRVRVVDPALFPDKPVKPNKPRLLVLGSLLGLLLAVGVTVTRESVDPTVHMIDDVTLATGLGSLGVVPHIDPPRQFALGNGTQKKPIGRGDQSRSHLGGVAMFDPQNPALEAYRTLRTNIIFARPDASSIRILVFTSPTPGDGKTTTTANLASTLAHQGLKVLLIDGDMRRGTLHQVFGLSREPGLSNLLVGETAFSDCVRKIHVGEVGSLDLLPCGASPPNPSELLSAQQMTALLAETKARYDSVIFDSPPLNLVTDAAVLATKADGVVLVGRAGVTTKGALVYAAELLRKVRAPILGFVLNDFVFRRDSRYSAYGGYGGYNSYAANPYSSAAVAPQNGFFRRLFGSKRANE